MARAFRNFFGRFSRQPFARESNRVSRTLSVALRRNFLREKR